MRALLILLLLPAFALAQGPKVPSRMEFAGIKLRIMDDARSEIQKDVDALTQSPKYFGIKAEKARAYFPIIERVFKEEGLPDDFKYLVLQESALIPDAVSSSNAVGFWQFKDFTAMEVGLRVDKHIDERMNIVSASRGAARYLIKNNDRYFDNWLMALQAYQMGAGAALKVGADKFQGIKSMTINKKTYWYVKKYLAHKIAFEGAVDQPGTYALGEYLSGANKSFRDIANETGASEEELAAYNKWLRTGKIPNDREYTVIIPNYQSQVRTSPMMASAKAQPRLNVIYDFKSESQFPKIDNRSAAMAGKVVEINELRGIIAGSGQRIAALARMGDISLSKFLKYNDLGIDGRLISGEVYYLQNKRGKAKTYEHVVQEGETLWAISQKYGIKLKKLAHKNRIRNFAEKLTEGRVLWLRHARPADEPIEYKQVKPAVRAKSQEELSKAQPKISEAAVKIEGKDEAVEVDTVKQGEVESLVREEGKAVLAEESDDMTRVEAEQSNSLDNATAEPQVPMEDLDMKEQPVDTLTFIRKTHAVEPGQTYYAISMLYGVSVLDLLEWNNLKITDKLSIGQKLIIMVPKTEAARYSSEFVDHAVQGGETLFQISRKYNVTIQQIMEWNQMKDFNLSPGQLLKIKKDIID